jgi:hypothetical protein
VATLPSAHSFTYQKLDRREACLSAFDTCMEAADRHICIFDRDGAYYGLERRQAAELISLFLLKNPSARIELIVQQLEFLEKRCARLIAVLHRFSPRFSVRVVEPGLGYLAKGFAVFDHKAMLRRPHFDRRLSFWDTDETAIGHAKELMEQIRQQSTLGLQLPTGL